MNILVVNDDGIDSKGLKLLAKACAHFGRVYVAAPALEQSARSHALSLTQNIKVETVSNGIIGADKILKVFGTPVDCVRVGMSLFDVEFDLIVSGINLGPNLATDVLYSGTIAAAMEGYLYRVPSIAFSAQSFDIPYLFDETVKLLDEIIEEELYLDTAVLNINFPKATYAKPLGTSITKQGRRVYETDHVPTDDETVYQQNFSLIRYQEDEDSDVTAFENGYVSITPLQIDQTDYKKIKSIKR